MTILDLTPISQLRRNHGLEHATINILSQWFPDKPVAGYSGPGGFVILGGLPTEHIRDAVAQALARLNNGERHLAIHPGCGTNMVASGFVAGLLAWLGMAGVKTKREKVERLPLVLSLATLGLILGQPLGPVIQEQVTTSGDPAGMTIVDIFPVKFGRFSMHRVITRG